MIGVLLIATRKYKVFIKPLLQQIDKFFLPKEELTVFLFIDGIFDYNPFDYDFVIRRIKIPPYKFPQATLYRYKIFDEHSEWVKECSHLFYLDVDMGVVGKVGPEILGEGLTVTRHPGFFGLGGWGANNVDEKSRAFIPPEGRNKYFAGGFQGGKTEVFLKMAKELAVNISEDEMDGIIAEHNDEAHLNHYVYSHPEIPRIELHSGYTMVESLYLRENWKIDHLPVFIIALDKNHNEIRS